LDFHVALKGRQHDDSRFRKFITNDNQRIDPADVGKPQIHEGDVGTVFPKQLDGLSGGRCLREEGHIRLTFDHHGYALP
jgi:hypothetical protein